MDQPALGVDDHREGQSTGAVAQLLGQRDGVVAAQEQRVVDLVVLGELDHLVGVVHRDADDLELAVLVLLVQRLELGHLVLARLAPGGPEVHQHGLAPVLRQRLELAVEVLEAGGEQRFGGRSARRSGIGLRGRRRCGRGRRTGKHQQAQDFPHRSAVHRIAPAGTAHFAPTRK
nr:hypothetical protein [Methylibium sp.]